MSIEDSTSSTTTDTTRRGDFRQRVLHRDSACILTGSPENLEACHVVPQAQSMEDGYMTNVVNIRSEVIVDPPFEGINDTRNGVTLSAFIHHAFEGSRFAFLRTPNYFMTVYDVDRVLQPTADLVHHASSANPEERRLTCQHFNNNNPIVTELAPHNCDANLPDEADWPPDMIFDAAYGVAAVKAWGTKPFKKFSRNSARDMYHEYEENGGGEGQRQPADRNERAERAANRAKKRNCNARRSPDVHDMILGLWMYNARKGHRKADAVKAEKTKEKVQEWLDSAV